jgi:hypothetical protein
LARTLQKHWFSTGDGRPPPGTTDFDLKDSAIRLNVTTAISRLIVFAPALCLAPPSDETPEHALLYSARSWPLSNQIRGVIELEMIGDPITPSKMMALIWTFPLLPLRSEGLRCREKQRTAR